VNTINDKKRTYEFKHAHATISLPAYKNYLRLDQQFNETGLVKSKHSPLVINIDSVDLHSTLVNRTWWLDQLQV